MSVQQLTTATTPLVETDGAGGHSPRVRANLAEVAGSDIGPGNPVPTRESGPTDATMLQLAQEMRALRITLCLWLGLPQLDPATL